MRGIVPPSRRVDELLEAKRVEVACQWSYIPGPGDDEPFELCCEPATHTTCDPVGGVVCDRHRCRCSKPLAKPVGTQS